MWYKKVTYMRQSHLFTKTRKEAPKDEESTNAKLLIRGGFINKEMAGVYAYLPLGLRVLNNISNIIREEMDAAGGQELFMTVLQDKDTWERTGRWDDKVVDNWFKTSLKNGTELGLGFTHEETIAKIMTNHIASYKDLPLYAYQIQTKFRNEARAKAGLMRGREFFMKDLYSFSKNKEEHEVFYEKMKDVYMRVFTRLGMGDKTYLTISSGGSFSKYSYEFQTISDAGEDTIYIIDEEKKIAINKDDFTDEVLADFNVTVAKDDLRQERSIEVGDIYSLGHKFSEAFGLTYKNEQGEDELVYMGSYGMSPSRLMGAIVELNHDDNGIMWPEGVAPYRVHLVNLHAQNEEVSALADEVYAALQGAGVAVLYDDRREAGIGEKLKDSDLVGIPLRAIISEKNGAQIEVKKRKEKDAHLVSKEQLLGLFTVDGQRSVVHGSQ